MKALTAKQIIKILETNGFILSRQKGSHQIYKQNNPQILTQMKYVFPVLVFFIAPVVFFAISSAVALYWIVSNVFSICHELYVKRKADGLMKA